MTSHIESIDELPGGKQDILAALAPGLLACLQQARRVVLLANNPAISEQDFQALKVDRQDVLVSFNSVVNGPLLPGRCSHVFVHGFNAPDQYFFGLPCAKALRPLVGGPKDRRFSLLVGVVGEMSPLPGVSLLRERIPLPPLWDYPRVSPGGRHYVGPTTGFNALVLLHWLRQTQGYRYQLLTLGFSNEAGKLWQGHAWDYERAWLAGADVQALALQHRPWWQRLFKWR